MSYKNQDLPTLLQTAAERLKADTNAIVFSWDKKTYILMDSNMSVVWGYGSIGDFVQRLREHYRLSSASLMLAKSFGTSLIHPYFLQKDKGPLSLSLCDAIVFVHGEVDPTALAQYLEQIIR